EDLEAKRLLQRVVPQVYIRAGDVTHRHGEALSRSNADHYDVEAGGLHVGPLQSRPTGTVGGGQNAPHGLWMRVGGEHPDGPFTVAARDIDHEVEMSIVGKPRDVVRDAPRIGDRCAQEDLGTVEHLDDVRGAVRAEVFPLEL